MADQAEDGEKADRQSARLGVRSRLRAAALILYFDTSALVKLLIQEEGSDLATRLWSSAYPAASSILSYPEGRAALGRALRQDRLDPIEYERALEDFEDLHRELVSLNVEDQLAQAAGEHATTFGLRAYDAVHLATALALAEDELVFVSWDRDLTSAAASSGLDVAGLEGW